MSVAPIPSQPVAAPKHPNVWAAFWQTLTRFQRDKVTPWIGLRNTIGVIAPLSIAAYLGSLHAGLAVATGALNVSYSDSHEPYIERVRRMLAAATLVAFAVCAGSLCGNQPSLAVLLTACGAFAAGMLVCLGTVAADLGTITLVILIVYSAVPLPPERAFLAGCLAFCGGILQAMLSIAFWPIRRYAPERRALAQLYDRLARAALQPIDIREAPPASAESTNAQRALETLSGNRSLESQRYRSLLNQAERLRLYLLALGRLHIRLQREPAAQVQAELTGGFLKAASRVLQSIALSLYSAKNVRPGPSWEDELDSIAEGLGQVDPGAPPGVRAIISDTRFQMDAIAGQLRSARELAEHATPEGLTDFFEAEQRKPWYLRLTGSLATLRSNLTLDSSACRHAIRLAVCILIGDALARSFQLHRAYWLPMTIAIVLKPDFSATFSRGILRLAGTFLGLAIATVIFHAVPATVGPEIALLGIFMFLMRCFGSANYGIFVTAVTALIVVLFALSGVSPTEVVSARALNTVLGGTIALAAYGLWPTWERSQIPELLARMLDGYRLYFQRLRWNYQNPSAENPAELESARLAARLARSNLEASVDRFRGEPGAPPQLVNSLDAILASSYRLIHALMALEAGLATSPPVPARQAFGDFANDLEFMMYYLAAALRGSALQQEKLPNLREDQRRLAHSGDSHQERYALVNVETDRVTNSLNTLVEHLLSSGLVRSSAN